MTQSSWDHVPWYHELLATKQRKLSQLMITDFWRHSQSFQQMYPGGRGWHNDNGAVHSVADDDVSFSYNKIQAYSSLRQRRSATQTRPPTSDYFCNKQRSIAPQLVELGCTFSLFSRQSSLNQIVSWWDCQGFRALPRLRAGPYTSSLLVYQLTWRWTILANLTSRELV